MAARKNGGHAVEALLEKIVGELRSLREDVNAGFRELRSDVHKLDARLDLMALGYRDLRDRVTDLEKPSS